MNRARLLAGTLSAAGVAVVVVAVGALAGGGQTAAQPGAPTRQSVQQVAPPGQLTGAADTSAALAALQQRLRQYPKDDGAWASLGFAYTQQARLTADPSYYGKADGAFARSLALKPQGNAAALTGQATLAAARHDFARALSLTQASDKLNAYGAANLGVMADALSELGRYPESFATLQRMVNLKPGVPSYTRISYSYELRGDLAGAKYALEQALDISQNPADAAFALQYLGELAFNAGDLATARKHFADGLARDPGYVPLLAGRARVEAADGDTAAALRDWQDVTTRLPQPTYLIEYADLLASLGRTGEATAQYAVVDATIGLFKAQGANVDHELALYDADHGRSDAALASAAAEIGRRQSIQVEDAYAWALHSAGRDAEALPHARKAAKLGMKNALFDYHRGVIELALGMKTQARASLTSALRTNPYFSPLQAPRAKSALAGLGGPVTP
ncbi:MAG: hypothetical protein ABIV05_04955 [Actinomycetota bacterium]